MATPSETQYQAFFNVHTYRMFRQNIRRELAGSSEPHFSSGNSGAEEARTPNLGIANAALSQLSYRPERRN